MWRNKSSNPAFNTPTTSVSTHMVGSLQMAPGRLAFRYSHLHLPTSDQGRSCDQKYWSVHLLLRKSVYKRRCNFCLEHIFLCWDHSLCAKSWASLWRGPHPVMSLKANPPAPNKPSVPCNPDQPSMGNFPTGPEPEFPDSWPSEAVR